MRSNIWLSLLAICGLLLALTSSVRAQEPNGYPQYFVPFNDTDLWQLFTGVNRCHRPDFGDVSPVLESVISLTASADGTQWFYDHWEDGYDPNPTSPQATTTVSGTLDAGESMVWPDSVITPRDSNLECEPGRFCYDGRDRISLLGEPAAVARMVYPSIVEGESGVVLATAWEVPEVGQWGTSYIATIGEDLDFNGDFVDDFDYAGLSVMAARAGTEVFYNGTLVATLEPGGVHFIAGANDGPGGGGVDSSDEITASAPIQVQSFVGGCAMSSGWSAQGFTLEPVTDWDNSYWAPVPDFTDSDGVAGDCNIDLNGHDGDDRDVDIYIHNPHDNDLTVVLTIPGSTYDGMSVTVPARTTQSVLGFTDWDDLPPDGNNTYAIQLVSTEAFWALSMVDSSTAGDNEPRINDWGYSLIPEGELSSEFVIGWGPGNNARPPSNNGNLAFVTAIADTRVFVDLNQDGTPDAFDMNGDGDALDVDVYDVPAFDEPSSNVGVPLAAGQVLRVGDSGDRRLGGALIYTHDLSQKIAVAWGQDACASDQAAPYLDLGYTPLAVVIPIISKSDELAIDADSSGDLSSGDTLDYTVVLKNNGCGPMFNVMLTDNFPHEWVDLVLGSIETTLPFQDPPGTEYDDGADTWIYQPTGPPGDTDANIQTFRLTWNALEAQETVTVTFRVVLEYGITVPEICNFAQATSDNTNPVDVNICNQVSPQKEITSTHTPTTTGTPSENGNGPPPEIPEPFTLLLLSIALAALVGYARNARRH